MKLLTKIKQLASKRRKLVFADAVRTDAMRTEINDFLYSVLPEDERENIESSFISDEANIYDCSLAIEADWQTNCRKAYGVSPSKEEWHLPLWQLVPLVKQRSLQS